MGLMDTLRGVDFYRKIPRDFTTASNSGAVISMSAAVIMALLFTMEFSTYMSSQWSTSIEVDQSEEDMFRIEFNVSLLHLQCQLADVAVVDVVGTKHYNITRNIQKWHLDLDGSVLAPAGTNAVASPEYEEMPEKDPSEMEPTKEHIHSDGEQIARLLKAADWEDAVSAQDVLMVNFFAPWCPWSKRLEPVWEHTAGLLIADHGTDRIAFAKVDCTDPDSHSLCHEQHINAFPSIRVYRHGANKQELKSAAGVSKGHSHEAFYGDRTSEAIKAFAEAVLAQDLASHEHEKTKTVQLAVAGHEHAQAQVGGAGCRISGSVTVRKVPGNLVLGATTPGAKYSFAGTALDLTHIVSGFRFTKPMSPMVEELKEKYLWWQQTHLVDQEFSASPPQPNATFEHYMKVVLKSRKYLNGEVLNTYEHTVNSHHYVAKTVPAVKFTYDISPMQVVELESHQAFYHFITNVCAIVGGVFTVAGIAEGLVHTGMQTLSKKIELGKAY